MTMQEVNRRYLVPIPVLEEYENWNLWNRESTKDSALQYDDRDLEFLSLVMTLQQAGFHGKEIESYVRLILNGDTTKKLRAKMLNQKRVDILDEIHRLEEQINRLDYLRYGNQSNRK